MVAASGRARRYKQGATTMAGADNIAVWILIGIGAAVTRRPLPHHAAFPSRIFCLPSCVQSSFLVSVPSSSGQRSRRERHPVTRVAVDVSVPSSSGQRSRRRETQPDPARRMFQSPLLRGNVRDSGRSSLRRARLRSFSPLFFGATFATACSEAARMSISRFSPLFFGATFATPFGVLDRAPVSLFQSPLLRGNVRDRWRFVGAVQDFSVSVPSSSGQRSRPRRTTTRGPWVMFQSPLLRGNVRDAGGTG